MSNPNRNIVPGWKMTFSQRGEYWRMFAQVCAALGWKGNSEQMSAYRREFHERAGLGPISAKDIDRMKGYDAIKKEWLAITQPANLTGQVEMVNMAKHRLITKIKSMAPEAYWRAILTGPRFNVNELEDLSEKELTDLRNTLDARKHSYHHPVVSEYSPVANVPRIDGVDQPF